MEWVQAGLVVVVVATAFWGPGAALGALAGLRGLTLASAAPLVTLGVVGIAAIGADAAGAPWTVATAGGAMLLAAAAFLGAARLDRRHGHGAHEPAVRSRGSRTWLAACIALGASAQVVPVAIGAGRPGRLLTAYDAVAHFDMVEFVRQSRSASSLTITGVHELDGASQGFYGAAWHGVVGLLGRWPDSATLFNVAVVVPTALAWTIGLTAMTRSAFPARPRVWCWAAAASAAGIAVPLILVLRPEGMVANAVAVALVPGLVALVTARTPGRAARWSVLVVAAAGVALTHPNALASAALVLLPWAVPRAGRQAGRLLSTGRARVLLAVGGTLATVAVITVATSDRMGQVVEVPPESPRAASDVILMVLSGDATGMGWGSGLLVVLAAVLGGVVGRRVAGARWIAGGAAVMTGLFVAATSAVPGLTDVDRLWYGEPRRFAPVMVAVLVPLAALGLDAGTRRLRSALDPAGRSRVRRALALGLGVLVIATSAAPAAIALGDLAHDSFVGAPGGPMSPVANDDELAMLRRVPAELDADLGVYGSPFSGASHLYGLTGQRVVPPTYLTRRTPDLDLVGERIADLGDDAQLCDALDRLGVQYLYVDPEPWNASTAGLTVAPSQGVRLLDSGGGAALYTITAC